MRKNGKWRFGKRFGAAALSLGLAAGSIWNPSPALAAETKEALKPQISGSVPGDRDTEEKTVVWDFGAYAGREILVLTESGELESYACASALELEEKIRELAERDDVSVIQPDYSYAGQALDVNDTSAAEQWALSNDGTFQIEETKNRYPVYENPFDEPAPPGEWSRFVGVLVETQVRNAVAGVDINVADAWLRYGAGTRDVTVAMIDTGIDYNHEDLAGAVWTNTDEIPENGIDDDGNGFVDDVYGWNFYNNNNQVFGGQDDSHGTHGAGTIAARINNGLGIAGIVPGDHVKIMPVKALGGRDGGGSTSSLIKAIRYAEDNGALICNLSLTATTEDEILKAAIANSSMLFIVAAGNGDSVTGKGLDIDQSPFYPASYDLDNIISVANINCDGTLHASSNYGAVSVDLAAPGSYILSTTPGNSYGYMSGTSMAAPMVTGAAAMVYTYFDGISPADVKEILLSTTTPLSDLAGKTVTGGMLNVGAALSYDLSGLSKTGFQNAGTRPEGGSAPYIESRVSLRMDGAYLMVRVVDVDGDLESLLYGEGDLDAEDFASGGYKAFTVNAQDTAVFKITNPATYTFYARDKRGNTAVKPVTFESIEAGPGAFS